MKVWSAGRWGAESDQDREWGNHSDGDRSRIAVWRTSRERQLTRLQSGGVLVAVMQAVDLWDGRDAPRADD